MDGRRVLLRRELGRREVPVKHVSIVYCDELSSIDSCTGGKLGLGAKQSLARGGKTLSKL